MALHTPPKPIILEYQFDRKAERKLKKERKSWPSTWSPSPKSRDVPSYSHTTFLLFCPITSSSLGRQTGRITSRSGNGICTWWKEKLWVLSILRPPEATLQTAGIVAGAGARRPHSKQGVTGTEDALVAHVPVYVLRRGSWSSEFDQMG